ncbi:MAG TPA: hypothetical protein VN905_02240 [Candidatus Binatia bacterium]|nr:hypothetical protein [Candidatus Binatia bacterium]
MTAVRISGTDELFAAIGSARSISLSSYILHPGRLVEALEAAGDRGADVSVRLEAAPLDPSGSLAATNLKVAEELRAHHVAAELTQTHLKAAVIDGETFLDDRNWAEHGPSTLIADSEPDDVGVVRAGIEGKVASDPHLWTRKGDALNAEAQLLLDAGSERIEVESESFGFGAVEQALAAKARDGDDVRLLVGARDATNPREASALKRLAAAGVHIRVAPFAEKIAVAGQQAWVGSANAGIFPSDMVDWGMRTQIPALVDALRARFEDNWSSPKAHPLE